VRLLDRSDPDSGERYTVKQYRGEKSATDGAWAHARVWLRPDNADFTPIELAPAQADQISVVAEVVEVLGR
jgi:hypothetical protein